MNASTSGRIAPGRLRFGAVACLATIGSGTLLSSCAEVGSGLGMVAAGFHQSLVGTAQQNYGPNYSQLVADLIVALTYKEFGIDRPGQQYPQGTQAGGSYPGGGYYGQSQPGQVGYSDPYQSGGAYGSPHGGQGSTQYPGQGQGAYSDPYASQGAGQNPGQGQGTYSDPYASQSQNTYSDPYASQGAGQYPGQAQGAYNDPYASQGQGAYSQDPYQRQRAAGDTDPSAANRLAATKAIDMTAALLAQRPNTDGTYRLEPIQDGDVLKDGRGDPSAGDKLKVLFAVDCDCYVYIIGIDATGFVAKVFPESAESLGNPVVPGRKYLLPPANEWWGLDQYRGVEQIYFVASFRQRNDIEQLLAALPDQRPGTRGGGYEPVPEPAVIPVPRGLIKVQEAPPVEVPTSYGTPVEVNPTTFAATIAGADLVVTRWFRHE